MRSWPALDDRRLPPSRYECRMLTSPMAGREDDWRRGEQSPASSPRFTPTRSLLTAFRAKLAGIGHGFAAQQREHPDEEDRNEHHAQQRRAQHAANDTRADGALARRTGAGCQRERHDAENEGHGSHDDRPEP